MNRNDANHKSNQSNPNNPAWQKANDNTSNQRKVDAKAVEVRLVMSRRVE